MKSLTGNVVNRLALLSLLLFMTAGCNGSGMAGDGSASVPVTTLTLLSGGSLGDFGSSEGDGGGDAQDPGDVDEGGDILFNDDASEGSDEAIAKVHNPEPASMLLVGIGLAGLARLRRKK